MNPDYSQYASWEKVTAPNGAVYYVVPESGYLYDPFLSNAKGRPVIFTDPRASVEKRRREEDRIKKASSPGAQVAQLGAGVGAAVAAPLIVDALKAPTAQGLAGPGQVFMSDGTIKGVGAAAQGAQAAAAPATTAGQAFTQGAFPAAAMPGGAPSGALMPGGAVPVEGIGYAPYLGAAGAALGAYGVNQAIQANDTTAGFLSGAGLGGGLAAAAPLLGFSPVGWGVLGASALGGALFGGGAVAAFGHESTKEAQKKRWGDLAERGIAGAAEGYTSMHQVANPGKNADGTKWKFEDALEQVKTTNPGQFRGVYGNFDTFGNDWIGYSDTQKDSIIQGLANSGLYYSKKGDVLIKDKAKAQEIKDQVLAGTFAAPAAQAQTPVQITGPQGVDLSGVGLKRSSTLSPGIGLDGQRIGQELAKRINARGRK